MHALVKFSPPRNAPKGIRWADLLIAERFDRTGEHVRDLHLQPPPLLRIGVTYHNTMISREAPFHTHGHLCLTRLRYRSLSPEMRVVACLPLDLAVAVVAAFMC
jgi:hypothetical protein